MGHFAKINNIDVVTDVIVISHEYDDDGQNYINDTLNLHGEWIKTSYNGNFAGIGYSYDRVNNIFISPKPYESWTLNNNYEWEPPVEYPDDDGVYIWDENSLEWIEQ